VHLFWWMSCNTLAILDSHFGRLSPHAHILKTKEEFLKWKVVCGKWYPWNQEFVEKSLSYGILSNYSKLVFFSSKNSRDGEVTTLRSDEKEKCINVKPSYTLPQDVPREAKRKVLWDEGTCVEIFLGPGDIHRYISFVPLLEMEAQSLKNVEKAVIHL